MANEKKKGSHDYKRESQYREHSFKTQLKKMTSPKRYLETVKRLLTWRHPAQQAKNPEKYKGGGKTVYRHGGGLEQHD